MPTCKLPLLMNCFWEFSIVSKCLNMKIVSDDKTSTIRVLLNNLINWILSQRRMVVPCFWNIRSEKIHRKQKLICKHQYTIYVHKYKNLSSDDVKHIWCLDTDWKMQKGQLTIIICKIIKTSRDCPMFAFGATSLSDRKDIWLARSVLRVLSSAVTHSKVWDTALLASLLHW